MNYKVVITESAYQDIDYILVFIVARQEYGFCEILS